jgi:hypothetical protein
VTVIFLPPLVSNLNFLYSRHLLLAATFGSCNFMASYHTAFILLLLYGMVVCALLGSFRAQQALAGGSVLGLSYLVPDPNVVLSRANRQPQVRPCGSSRSMSVTRLWVRPSVECPES